MKKTPYIISLVAVLVLMFVTCHKRPEMKIYNLEINEENVETTATSVEITVHYTYPTKLEYVNVYLSINGDLSNSTIVQATIDQNTFTTTFSNLLENTRYFYRFEYSNGVNLIKTDIHNFTTLGYSLPSVTTANITEITANSAVCGGNVIYNGGANVTARGVCWSTEPNPTISNNYTSNGLGNGEFNSELTNLEANVKYYVRAYATNSYGTSYGDEKEFTTVMGSPSVTTKSVTNITVSTATCGGNVTNDGGGTITTRGVCWSTTSNPTIAHNHTTDGTGVGEFTSYITELDNNTTYYVRAYAISSYGTAYGEERSFTTQEGLAMLTTNGITNITATSAIGGGNIIDDGGYSIIARGVCWSISQNPTITDNHTTDGTGIGMFTSNISGLTYNTNYYVRAYATNSKGTSYGEEVMFSTSKLPPVVTTEDISSITSNTAICGGNVTDNGGSTVSARGVCWSTSQNPTTSNSHTSDGNGNGTFVSVLSGLNESTTYYVRAYAINEIGTSYGEQKSFTTTHGVDVPTVTTAEISSITSNSAICGGNVLSEGYGIVSARGVCWSTSQNPTITHSHTVDNNGLGDFISNITGLNENTTYYVRAYATNEAGTAYGDQKEFTTEHAITIPTVTTSSVSDITSNSAISGGNVTSAGYGIVSARGICYSTTQFPTINNSHTTDGNGIGNFTSTLIDLAENTTYYVRAYATNEAGTGYGPQISFKTEIEQIWENGVLPGVFSVSATQQVHFSQGNLQYIGSALVPHWRFADYQWDFFGDNGQYGDGVDIDRDLFGWGTSGYHNPNDPCNVNYYPYSVGGSFVHAGNCWGYGPSLITTIDDYDLIGSSANYDWGVYNAIQNGGNMSNMWRTLSRYEWTYVFNTRQTNSNMRYAKAQINNVNGVILLPDDWDPSYYPLYSTNAYNANYTVNVISGETFRNSLECHGAVFLPCAGIRYNEYIMGSYWSTTHDSENFVTINYTDVYSVYAYCISFYSNSIQVEYSHQDRSYGLSVRLVQNIR